MRRIALIWVLLLPGFAQAQDSLTVRSLHSLEPVRALADASDYAVTAPLFQPWKEGTETEVLYRFRMEDRARMPQVGNGLSQGEFQARSLYRLDTKSVVRGEVSYERGVRRNVLWNTSSDFDLLYPYVMADTVGGSLNREQYAFTGAYAREAGVWHFGLEGRYRAQHEYRQVDPRPRNVSSDLQVRLTAGRRLGGHSLTWTGGYRRYHQMQAVSFMNPKGANTAEFHLTGLGSHFARFAGSGAFTDVRYRGRGAETAVLFQPLSGSGLSAGVHYSVFEAVRHLPNQNEIPYTQLLVQNLAAFAAWRSDGPSFSWAARLALSYGLRQGSEAVVPAVVASGVEDLLQLTLYRNRQPSVQVDGILQWNQLAGYWSLEPDARYALSDATRLAPSRQMRIPDLGGGLAGHYLRTSGRWVMEVRLRMGYTVHPGGKLLLPTEDPAFIRMHYQSMFEVFTSDVAELDLSGRLQRSFGRMGLYLRPEVAYLRYSVSGWNAVAAILATGLRF